MNDNDARDIAENFIRQNRGNFEYDFIGIVRSERFPNEINANFTVRNEYGVPLDGPVVVVIDQVNKTARFFNT